MSGFTLVILVMLIMFAAVAIVMTQDDEHLSPEAIEEEQAILAEGEEIAEMPAPEILDEDQIFTDADTLRIDVLEAQIDERPAEKPLFQPTDSE